MIPITIIKLLLGHWITDAEGEIKAQWRWIIATPVHVLMAVLALSIAFNLFGWHEWSVRGDTIARLTTSAAKTRAAQNTATDTQIRVNQLPALVSANLARQSDAQAPAYYAAVRGAVAAHDVVRPPACPISHANLPGSNPVASVNDRPIADADLVSRPKADDDLIVAAAGRATQMHQDAIDLIAAGDAVADDADQQQ